MSGLSGTTKVRFDGRLYSASIVKKAAYRFLGSFTPEIVQDGDDWLCTLSFVGKPKPDEIQRLIREFQAEVLDQDLRASISRETEAVRNTILALAFSRTGLQGRE